MRYAVKRIYFLALLAALPIHAQTWYSPWPQIVDGSTVTFTSTVTVRYGQNVSTCVVTYLTCIAGKPSLASWLPPVTISASTASPVTIAVGTVWAKSDPAPGVYKQLQIQQTSTSQTIKVVSDTTTTTVTIPALPAPSWRFSCPALMTGTVSSMGIITLGTVTLTGTCPGVKQ